MYPRIPWELGAHLWNHCSRSYTYILSTRPC